MPGEARAAYVQDPVTYPRPLQLPGAFLRAVQEVVTEDEARAFHLLYLERMGGELLSDVPSDKLGAMHKKVSSMGPDERAPYIRKVLAKET